VMPNYLARRVTGSRPAANNLQAKSIVTTPLRRQKPEPRVEPATVEAGEAFFRRCRDGACTFYADAAAGWASTLANGLNVSAIAKAPSPTAHEPI
jgi:hypothetical protein